MKTLYFDTESTDLSASWGRLLCASFAVNDGKVQTYRGDEKPYKGRNRIDDSKLVIAIREELEAADMIVGWNCLEACHRVLTDDLRWVAAGDLKPGDGLAAFDEASNVRNQVRRLRRAEVTENTPRMDECFEVGLEDGSIIATTAAHPWLSCSGKLANNQRWLRTDKLKPKQSRVFKMFDPWDDPTSYGDGWLAGFVDGEGSLSQGPGPMVSFYQKAGPLFEKAVAAAQAHGFDVRVDARGRQALGGETQCARINGGWRETIRFLGSIRPERLLDKFDLDQAGTLKSRATKALQVEYVEPVGRQEIAVLGSSSQTYIADGYAMHNSILHDVPLLNARLAKVDERPIRSGEKYGTWHLDLMYYATGQSMKIGGKALDKVAKYFQCENQKTPLDGETWQLAGAGDSEALDSIVEHCEADVEVLREVAQHLYPYVKKFKLDLSEVYPHLADIPSRR